MNFVFLKQSNKIYSVFNAEINEKFDKQFYNILMTVTFIIFYIYNNHKQHFAKIMQLKSAKCVSLIHRSFFVHQSIFVLTVSLKFCVFNCDLVTLVNVRLTHTLNVEYTTRADFTCSAQNYSLLSV